MDIHEKKLSSPKILKLPYGMEETCIPEGNLARYMVSTSLTRKDNERQRGGDTIEKYECPSMSQYMSHLKSDVSKSIHLVTTGSKKEQTALITKDPKIAMKLAVPGVKACHVMTVKTTVTPRNLSKPSSLSSPKSNLQKIPPKIENIVKETKNKGGVKTSHIMQLPMNGMVISPSVITKGKILPRKTAQTSSASETIKVIQHPGKVNITLSKGAIPKADTLHFLNIKDKIKSPYSTNIAGRDNCSNISSQIKTNIKMVRASRIELFSSKSPRSLSSVTNTGKDYYYYYVFRKKIDPTGIKGPGDFPASSLFRRSFLERETMSGSLPGLTDIRELHTSSTSNSPHSFPLQSVNAEPRTRKRSRSLPELKKSGKTLQDEESKTNLKQIRKESKLPNRRKTGLELIGSNKKSLPLPGITKINKNEHHTASNSADSTNYGHKMVTYPMSLLRLTPEDGLQWSRHTTISKGPHGVAEKIIDVQIKKVFKDGKWMEETTKTERISNDQGSTTVSTKTNHRELPPKDNLNQPSGLNNKQISSTGSSPNATPSRLVPLPGLKKAQQVTKQTAPQHLPAVKDDLDSFARRVLVSANNYRRIHGVLPLVISDKLNALAKEWAEKLAKMEKMEHSDKNDIGENIYCKTSSQPWFEVKGEEVVENWYNEVEDHNYEEEPKQGFLKTGHFTQLVWKDTKEMGVAFARNKNGHMAFVVANFTPKGNWIGEFKQQVFPPGGASKRGKLRHTLKDQKQSTIKYKIPNSQINGNIKSSHEILGQRPKSDPPNSVLPRINSRNSTAASPGTATADVRSPMVDSRKILSPSSQTSKSTINSSESYNRRPLSSSVSRRSSTTSKMAEEKFFEDFVKAHNYYRKKHGVKPLRMDKKLSKYAQEWADHLAKLDRMQHRSETDYGENIYMKWSPDPNHRIPGEEAVDSWYEEIKEYKFGKEPHDLGAGHFTQLVWADSEELGVGVAKSHSNKIYVVANYNPPGNYIGQFSSKVPPPL